MARPYEEFSWPLDVDPGLLIHDYLISPHEIEKINGHDFLFQMRPAGHCKGEQKVKHTGLPI